MNEETIYSNSEWDSSVVDSNEPNDDQPSIEELYAVATSEEDIQAVQAYESGDLEYIEAPTTEVMQSNKGLLVAGGLAALYFLLNK